MMRYQSSVKLAILDWAGTIVDHGSMAPVMGFVNIFKSRGISISLMQARGPMGLDKFDHLKALMELPEIAQAWVDAFGDSCSDEELRSLYEEELIPSHLGIIACACRPIAGLENTVDYLRSRGIKIGTTTGYFPQANEINLVEAKKFGFVPDACSCAGNVSRGRPEPDMIQSVMQQTHVIDSDGVVKVDDSVPGVEAGLRAGVWTVGITRTGNLVGLDEQEWKALDERVQKEKIRQAEQIMRDAGSHFQIESIAQLPGVIEDIESRLAAGEKAGSHTVHQV